MIEEAHDNSVEAMIVLHEDFENVTATSEPTKTSYGYSLDYLFCLIPLVPLWCVLYAMRVQMTNPVNNQAEDYV